MQPNKSVSQGQTWSIMVKTSELQGKHINHNHGTSVAIEKLNIVKIHKLQLEQLSHLACNSLICPAIRSYGPLLTLMVHMSLVWSATHSFRLWLTCLACCLLVSNAVYSGLKRSVHSPYRSQFQETNRSGAKFWNASRIWVLQLLNIQSAVSQLLFFFF